MAQHVFTHGAGQAVIVRKGANAYDYTAPILKANPELASASITQQLIDNSNAITPEGKLKVIYPVKTNMTNTASSAHVVSQDAEASRLDTQEFTFEKEWTKKIRYNKGIDLKANETAGRVGADLGSLAMDNRENIDVSFYSTLAAALTAVQTIKDLEGADLVSVPANHAITAGTGATDLADAIEDALIKASRTGEKGEGVYEKHPNFRGINYSNFTIVLAVEEIKTLSKDPRWIAINTAQAGNVKALNGQVGTFLNVPVLIDKRLGQLTLNTKKAKALIIPTGSFSPIALGVRVPFTSAVVDSPNFSIAYEELQVLCNWQLFVKSHYVFATYAIV